MVITFKIYSLNNLQVPKTVLLTVVTVLHVRSPDLIRLKAGRWCPLTNMSYFHPPRALAPTSTLYLYEVGRVRFHM